MKLKHAQKKNNSSVTLNHNPTSPEYRALFGAYQVNDPNLSIDVPSFVLPGSKAELSALKSMSPHVTDKNERMKMDLDTFSIESDEMKVLNSKFKTNKIKRPPTEKKLIKKAKTYRALMLLFFVSMLITNVAFAAIVLL